MGRRTITKHSPCPILYRVLHGPSTWAGERIHREALFEQRPEHDAMPQRIKIMFSVRSDSICNRSDQSTPAEEWVWYSRGQNFEGNECHGVDVAGS